MRQGTHGTSVPGVARTLIEEGIRLAIKDGLLVDPRQWQDDLTGAFGTRRLDVRTWDRDMPANVPTWTAERIELLKSHFEAGLSCREIAADIGVSRNAVIGKLSRLNLTRGKKRRTRPREGPKGRRARNVPRLQYQMLRAVYAEPRARVDDGRSQANTAARCSS